ncbi:MAG: zeta toxin family protein, partial [Malacoplasma sp.]|nr:zeta toxin family protein [Malacoplasma sp.]
MESVEMEKLRKKYTIKEKELDNLIKNVLNEITADKEKGLLYCNFIIGPQASGKSTLSDFLIREDSNLVRINGDFIRSKYPNYKEISSLYPTEVFDILKKDLIYLRDEILSRLIERRYSFNKEYSLNNIEKIFNNTKKAYDLGYKIDYYLLLTDSLEIHIRAVERFFNQLKDGKNPRIVAASRQENAIKQMQYFISKIEIDLINDIKIVDHDGNICSIKKSELSSNLLDKY